MTPSKIFFYFCVSLIAGIFLESVFNTPQFILWIFLFIGFLIIIISALLRKDIFIVAGFCVIFLVLGAIRLQISEFNIANDKLSKLNDSSEDIILIGTIIKEPEIRELSQKIKLKIDEFGSMVLVTTNRYPEYQYLDKVKITGKLKTPVETEDFSYKNYLLKDYIYSVIYFPQIEVIGKANWTTFSVFYSGILWIKEKLRQSIKNNFLPPKSSLLEGVILGDKSAISQDIKDKFRITGLSHLIAVSGMHVVILSTIIMSFLLFVGLWRSQAFYGAVIFILIYIVLVGLPSSGIRAGIMGIIYLLAQKIGRQTISPRIIVLAAALMLLVNPLLLFYDIGFQLSFLAVLGLIYLEPLIRYFLKFLSYRFLKFEIKEKYERALMIFSATMSAQIFTLSVIIYNFGDFSFVSLLSNALILPIVPIIMFFGFLSSLTGIIFDVFGWILSLPCYFLLEYFFFVVNIFSKPWAHKTVSNVSLIWVLIYYLILIFIIWFLNKKYNQKII